MHVIEKKKYAFLDRISSKIKDFLNRCLIMTIFQHDFWFNIPFAMKMISIIYGLTHIFNNEIEAFLDKISNGINLFKFNLFLI